MGVAGAAIATITSQLFSACMVVYALIHTDDMYKLVWSKVRIDERMLRRIVRIGIPAVCSLLCIIFQILSSRLV